MNIYIQKVGLMSTTGSGLLRSLQNTKTPVLDLLTREAIQNSLDAGFANQDVIVDIEVGEFNPKDLNKRLKGITEKLNENFPDEKEQYLMFGDKNTEGLTGPLTHGEVVDNQYGNLLKLVYDFSKPQEQEGAGGSWGYGKTIYYRVGIGLVLYYTRIRGDFGVYEERLATILVEDEKAEETYVPPIINENGNYNKSGIAWWGDSDSEGEITKPLTNSEEIRKVLDIFNLKPYKNEETGTMIIMPYLDKKKLLSGNSLNDYNGLNVYDDLIEYLRYSTQRWYAPRINNKYYKYGKKNNLIINLNKERLDTNDQDPYFNLIRNMYNYAITNNSDFLEKYSSSKYKLKTVSVQDRKISSNTVGDFVYGEFDYIDVGLNQPYANINPHLLSNLTKEDEHENLPIILYTRQPGMIVSYEDRGAWTYLVQPSNISKYIIGFFVLNSNPNTYYNTNQGRLTVEEYIRNGEKSDHTSWHDKSIYEEDNNTYSPSLVSKIQNNISRTIREEFREKEKIVRTNNTEYFANMLGNRIMPPMGFGKSTKKKAPKPTGETGGGVRKARGISYRIDIDNITRYDNDLLIPFEYTILSDNIKNIEINLEINRESGTYTLSKFEEDTGLHSPMEFVDISIPLITGIDLESHKTINGTNSGYFIKSNYVKSSVIKGVIKIRNNNKFLSPRIRISCKEDSL